MIATWAIGHFPGTAALSHGKALAGCARFSEEAIMSRIPVNLPQVQMWRLAADRRITG
jgi:hypothetical protein